jgi:hypothetical protein
MTATFVSSTNTVSTLSGSTVNYSGNADRINIQEYSRATGALIGAALTQYPAFSSNFTELRIENTPSYTSTDVVFKK